MRIFAVTIDCSDPHRLARFYQSLLGGSIAVTNDAFAALTVDEGPRVDFQRVDNYRAPAWPDPDNPAQLHLDLVVENLDEAERRATAVGASKADHQPGGARFRVFIDPEGHPFCLVTPAAASIG
ncbi:MAG TPA: VOC family protein [Nocardioidaceae bacterium]|nr:VOC family protein [Nocardioidaceae bacterium]